MPRSQTARPRERAHARSGSAPSARPATHRRLVVPFMACGVLLTSTLATWYALSPARTMTGRGIAGCSTNSSAAAVGQCAPDFALADSHGRTLRLTHYRGHPVLLNFWGVGCDQCALELPDLKRFAGPFTRRGGVVLGVNTWGEYPGLIAAYARTRQVTWPLLPNPPGDVGSLYGVRGTPTNVFVDRRGVIRAIAVGPQTVAQFQAYAQGL